ncbi:MAG TPA: hypothetical protein VFD39_06960, partial [Trueperaceae bacterium]|nr:hypothetical protein [Trueperaceae bacterium]
MSDVETQTPAPSVATDLEDERLQQGQALGDTLSELARRVRAGDLGILPVAAGLVVIAIVFNSLNSIFLSSGNLSNILLESVPVGVIALGIVCVLLVAQIDLSVGSVSGLSAALLAVLWIDKGLPAALAVVLALMAGAVIGWLYGQMFNRVGVPSFVITLAGLLAFLGVQLWLLGTKGAVNLPFDSTLVKFAQLEFVPKWLSYVFVIAAAAGLFAAGYGRAQERRRAGLSDQSVMLLAARSFALLLGLGLLVYYLNQTRGVGWMFVGFLGLVLVMHYVLTRTAFGRSMFAVGGNPEAARRAGIDVNRVYTSVFVLCSSLAALG